mmetsp:Transcript_139107/g.242037  ORF Transcript_139107/g.242037 Transcript_139107/m.242037 type:complete len:137 (-) Transcript_139107:67-477(-)
MRTSFPCAMQLAFLCFLAALGFGACRLGESRVELAVGNDHKGVAAPRRRPAAKVELQMSMSTQRMRRLGAGGTVGFRLHRRRERVHIWSKPCRKLKMSLRAACERKLDAEVLQDKTWVPLRPMNDGAAFTVKLDHD